MTTVPLLNAERRWACPNCDFTDVTWRPDQHSRFHSCRGLRGLSAPMIPAGTKAKVEAMDRGDYLNGELAHRDGDGNVVMSVVTTRDDGQDCAVYAPPARTVAD